MWGVEGEQGWGQNGGIGVVVVVDRGGGEGGL